MSRRLRRSLAAVVPLLLIPMLAACGSAKIGYGDSTKSGWDAISISGDFGKAPTVKWNAALAYPSTTTTKTLIKGTGDPVKAGDVINAYVWIGDGTTRKEAYSDYTNNATEQLKNDSSLGAFWSQLLKGATIGSRVAAVTNSVAVLGDAGNPQLGIGSRDSLVVLVDLVSQSLPPKPVTPKDVPLSQLPKLLLKDGKPTGFDFKGIAKPSATGDLLRAIVTKGTGAPLTADSTITVDYLGMVYDAKTPFDESYTKTPLTSALSGLVKGWQYGLTGVPVGSRVILQIPPALGYGDSAQAAIPANSTLYFVRDIKSAQ